MTPPLHMQTTRIPTREFREPNPKSNNVQDKRHCPQTGKGEKKDRYREQRNTKHVTIIMNLYKSTLHCNDYEF